MSYLNRGEFTGILIETAENRQTRCRYLLPENVEKGPDYLINSYDPSDKIPKTVNNENTR